MIRPVGDELLALDHKSNQTILLDAHAAAAFQSPGMDHRALLRGGAVAGGMVAFGAIQTLGTPDLAMATSGFTKDDSGTQTTTVDVRGLAFVTFSCPGGGRRLCPPSVATERRSLARSPRGWAQQL